MKPLPWWTRLAFRLLLERDERRSIRGDLEELYELRRERHGECAADAWLRRQAARYPAHLLLARLRPIPGQAPYAPGALLDDPRFDREGEPVRNWLRDLRHSLRGLARSPLLAATIILTVGLGLGATTVLWSVVHGILIEPLPYRDASKIVRIFKDAPPHRGNLSVADYRGVVEQQTSFSEIAGFTSATLTFQSADAAERIRGKLVTGGYFSLLGISPELGRDFGPQDGKPRSEPAVIVSQGFWRRHLGADPAAIGQTLRFDGTEYRLLGVLPRSAGPLEEGREVFVAVDWPEPPRRGPFFIIALGRLRPDVAPATATTELRAINERLFERWSSDSQDRETSLGMVQLKEQVVGDQKTRLVMALGAVILVWLIACANAANLLVARVLHRRRELAVRSALGASRGRLVQHLLAESSLLAAGAAGLGLALAAGGIRSLAVFGSHNLPRLGEIGFNASVLFFFLALTVMSGLLFGLVPAMVGAAARIGAGAGQGIRSTAGPGTRRLRNALVMAQFAVATPLLISAGLLLTSLLRLQNVDLGIERQNLLTAAVLLPDTQYPELSDVLGFWDEAKRNVEAIPGIDGVAYSDARPPYDTGMANNFFVEEKPTPPGAADPVVPWVASTPDYFPLMGISLLGGRLLDERDGVDGLNAVVVDQAWAARFFPGESVIGKRLRQGGCPECPWAEVVGLVNDVEYNGLTQPNEGTIYWPLAERPLDHAITQITQRFRYFVIRTSLDSATVLPSLRRTLRELDPTLALFRVATIDDLMSRSLERPRHLSLLVGLFAGIALLLSVVGIYGVLSHIVEQQKREIGIRMVLGGDGGQLQRMIVGLGMRVVTVGLMIGLGAAWLLGHLISSLLFGVEANDVPTMLGVVALMALAALLACLLPARRAAGVDPAVTLREE